MTDTDLSGWLLGMEAAMRIGCSTRTIERLAHDRKLEQRLRPQAGSPPVAVYNPDDVDRIAFARRPAPAPFVLDAVPDSANGNGKGHRADLTKVHFENAISGEDPIRQLAAAFQRFLLSPPSPPVSATVSENPFLTIAEAAAYVQLPAIEIRRACESKELPARQTGRGGWRIRRKDLEAL